MQQIDGESGEVHEEDQLDKEEEQTVPAGLESALSEQNTGEKREPFHVQSYKRVSQSLCCDEIICHK
jgi:hypothetical protein